MVNRLKWWELIYLFINSSFKAILWLIPIVLTIVSLSAYYFLPNANIYILIGVIIFSFLVVGFIQISITRKIEILKVAISETSEMLRQDRNNRIEEISTREARVYPDEGKVALSEYNKLIQAIHKNGYYEFDCQPLGKIEDSSKGIMLFMIYPGMSKIYLIGAQHTSLGVKEVFRIYSPDDIDDRDFAITWFNNIFRILGNTSSGISELQSGFTPAPDSEVQGDYYIISKYKFIKRRKRYIFRLYIN